MEKQTATLLIIIAAVAFIVGGGLGVFYQKQAVKALTPEDTAKIDAVKILSSKAIPPITAYGKVAKIEGRVLTIEHVGDSIDVNVKDGAQVYFPASTATSDDGKKITLPQQAAVFGDIKVGNNVSINVKLLPDGQIEGQIIIILQN